jgi:diguanylate cyclase (GGDEF)-like protein
MDLHPPSLLLACLLFVALSAGALVLFGKTQRVHRGYWWWVAAQALLALALLLAALPAAAPLAPLATLLLLQWPIVVLAGLRRYASRQPPAVPPAADWALLAVAGAAVLVLEAVAPGLEIVAPAIAPLALNLDAAVLLTRLSGFAASPALKSLAAIQAASAGVQTAWLAYASAEPARLAALHPVIATLPTVVSALVLAWVALLLSFERSLRSLRASHRKLRNLVDIDELTRLPNRRRFDELAVRSLADAEPASAALLLLDVDHLKVINDLLGAATGDEALRQVGHALRETLRGLDVAGRVGGDEFAALLPQTSIDNAMKAAARIVARLDDRQVAPRIARVSLSIGVIQLKADEAIGAALVRAEDALNQARVQGRDRAVAAHAAPARRPVEPKIDAAPAV